MCRFARECMLKTRTLVRKLEIRLGPDTADLAMRMGIHSGPVTGMSCFNLIVLFLTFHVP